MKAGSGPSDDRNAKSIRNLSVSVAVAILTFATPAAAQSDEASVYRVGWALDLPLLAASAAVWQLTPLLRGELVTPSCPCRAADVNALDRGAVGLRSDVARGASDAIVATM